MERDSYFDSLKWGLIILVIYGHMISNNYYPGGSFGRAMYNTLYLFHMPLFVFLSGRFSQLNDRKRYRKGMLRLLESYFVFQVLLTLYNVMQGYDFSLSEFLLQPVYVMWYLISLISWRLMVYFMGDNVMLRYPKAVVVLSFVFCLAAGLFKHEMPLALQPTMVFMPFFLLGYYSVKVDLRQLVRKVPLWLAIFIVVAVFAVCYFLLNRSMRVLLASFVYRTPKDVAIRVAYMVVSMVMCVAVMRCWPGGKTMARWGRNTLFMYLWHPFVMFLICNVLPMSVRRADVWPVVYAFFSAALLTWLSRYEILNQLLNPISYVVSKFKKPVVRDDN